jgi:oxygen-independent coproporphyrinogen III oxidase
MSLGIYIQIPFCQTKCTYCNFHTGVVARDRYQAYADAVCHEIAEYSAIEGGEADTIYFGGGTPSLFEAKALAQILEAIEAKFAFVSGEVTLEADPETIAAEKAAAWRAAGFNRVSLGSQSFNDVELKSAGRLHRRADIARASKTLRDAGFANISFDLIAGLPHQTRESWEDSVTQLLALKPEHISIYMLEIDEGSRLGRESLAQGSRYSAGAIPADDAIAEFYESACARLKEAGYEHYEISNWSLPARRSKHNLKYWQRQPYLGFGAGAHSFDGQKRWANAHDSARYVALIEQGSSTREQIEVVTPEQALDEEFFLGLRQLEGIDLARIEREYGANDAANSQRHRVAALRSRIATLSEQGLLELDGSRLRLAPSRLTVSNEAFVGLLE